ncbi:uncharacterized protein LOC135481710 [Liolophura sinensis]|uniref:uncharacterized protein LOC135481710 n=1 Tax=Liolophura sinensis TaxID=3198878 RepID=UPI0031580CB3
MSDSSDVQTPISENLGLFPDKKFYSIYATPDNEETVQKTYVMLKRGLGIGSYISVCEMISFSKPTTPFTMLGRYCSVCLPIAAMAVSYPAVVGITSNLRNEDGPLNHFIAGFVSGTILGTRMKSHKIAWGAGLALGFIGVCMKHRAIEGWEWTKPPYKSRGFFHQYDYTLVPGMDHRKLEPSDNA